MLLYMYYFYIILYVIIWEKKFHLQNGYVLNPT